jgi:hypothetical protein
MRAVGSRSNSRGAPFTRAPAARPAEPWGVRRFFVEDPSGTVVNVLADLP